MNTPLPRRCYVLIEHNKPGNRIGLAYKGETGYVPLDGAEPKADMTTRQVERHIDSLNESLGISREQRLAMQWGSMFGVWNDAGSKAETWVDEHRLVTA
jgi:hypothetical protein